MRARRLELGMSQETLAGLLGITFQQVQKYEKGVNRIAASRLYDIANVLEVPAASFFDGLGNAPAKHKGAEGYEDVLATPEGRALLNAFSTIQHKHIRRKVLALVRAMIED